MTCPLPLYVWATCDQKVGEWSASAMGTWLLASVLPGAVQCRSRMTTIPFWVSRFTQPAMAFW